MTPKAAALTAALVTLVAVGGCGGTSAESDPPPPAEARVVVAELDTTDSEVLGELYRRLLDQAGFATQVRRFEARELYLQPLEDGDVQVAPDYLSAAADALNRIEAGREAATVGSADPARARQTLTSLGEQHGIDVLEPARAEVGTQYAVTTATARRWDLRTLSDLGRSGRAVSLGTAPDCLPSRTCTQGLEQTYGIRLDRVAPLETGAAEALRGGTVQLAQVATTDPALDGGDLVVLADDESLLQAQNVVPLVGADWLTGHERARETLDALAPLLTTADLRRLVARVQAGESPGEVAQDHLTELGLLQP